MRPAIVLVILGSILVSLVVLVGTADQPRDDELARSISRLVERTR
ncbi:MAG TPA: hypothetical protein VFL83_07345 [Anaeromyxobacter sp.]|nr:hypothetical protein [Anaeromyxobacter sp.]